MRLTAKLLLVRYDESFPDRKITGNFCIFTPVIRNKACRQKILGFNFNIRKMISNSVRALLPLLVLFIAAGCGDDDQQREFEQQAFQLPDGITETEGNGTIISEDPDDWRTSPFFQGLVFINPAFPNPVSIGDRLNIEVDIAGIDAVSGLTVAVLIDDAANAQFRSLYTVSQNPLPPGLTSIPINPVELGRFNSPESARGIHRLIIYDNRQNIISYGDVRVE